MNRWGIAVIFVIGVLFSLSFVSAESLYTPDLYWKFDETSSTNATDSVNGYLLLNNNGDVDFTSGKLGNAADFLTNTDKLNMTSNSYLAFGTGNFTVAFWMNMSSYTSSGWILFNKPQVAQGWGVSSGAAPVLAFVNNNAPILNTSILMNDSLWHRVVFVRENTASNGFRVYVDSDNKYNATLSSDMTQATEQFVVQSENCLFSMDDFRIYKGYAWTNEEVITDWNSGIGQSISGLTVSLVSPQNNSFLSNSSITFLSNVTLFGSGGHNITNSTLNIWYKNGTLFSSSLNNTIVGVQNESYFNVTNLEPNNFYWNMYICSANSTSTLCRYGTSNWSFLYGLRDINTNYITPVYETTSATYNISFNVSSGTPTAKLWYNGTSYSGSGLNLGGNSWIFTKDIVMPSGAGVKNIFWEILLSSFDYNTTLETQSVNDANLSICGGDGGNQQYINFTFIDETTLTAIDAYVDSSTWNYWLGDGTETITYTFSNTTGTNTNYAFCFTPQDQTVNLDLTFKYSNTTYPQRTYSLDGSSLTNSTTNQALYLLSSDDGIYTAIQVADSSGSVISGVLLVVERQINDVWTIIGQQTTGSDGLATFWVNPNFPHRITATKSGYSNAQVTITPSQSTYTLVMSKTGVSATYNGTLKNMKWKITPSVGRLDAGTNTFEFNLTASDNNLDGSYCKFELTNAENGTVLSSTTGGSSGGCNLSISYVTQDNQKLKGIYYIDNDLTSGFTIIDADAYWIVLETDVSNKIFTNFLEDLKDLPEFGDGLRQEYSRVVFFFFMVFILVGLLTYFTGYDFANPGTAMFIIYPFILLASIAGWFNFTGLTPYTWMDQYSIALIASFIVGGKLLDYFGKT